MNKPVSELEQDAFERAASATSLAVLVVGMHRSGTSAISGVLNHLGVAVPDDLHPADQHNQRGYFEPQKIIDFHETLLARIGSPSNDPLPIGYEWMESEIGARAVEELAGLLDEEMGSAPMRLFKDPRICRLMPVWIAALKLAGRDAVAVLPYRHPLEVAGSLNAKAGLSRPYALAMWLQHVILGERFTRGMRRGFVAYEALLADWRAATAKLSGDLGVVWPRDLMRAGVEVDAFLTGELRRQKPPERALNADGLELLCERAWAVLPMLQANAYDARAQGEMDRIAAEFEAVVGVLGPLVVSLQDDLGRTRGELDRTLKGVGDLLEVEKILRAGVEERDQVIARQTPALKAAERRAAIAEAARDSVRARLVQWERDLQWALAELNTRQTHIDHIQGELARVQGRLHAIEHSTIWKLSSVVRRPFERYPVLRRAVRGVLKLGWWASTFQLGRKLREREALLAGAAPQALAQAPAPQRAVGGKPVAAAVKAAPSAAPHVAFLSGEATTPGHAYRVLRWAEAARAAGATASVARKEELPSRLADFEKADLIYIWRTAWDDEVATLVETAKARKIPILFDVDDLLMEPEQAKSEVIDGIRSQKFDEAQVRAHFEAMQRTFLAADFCSAPTEMLAHRLRRYGHPAFVLPNGFDDEVRTRSRLAARRRRVLDSGGDGLIRIGYATGSKTHQKDFAQAAEGIARVLAEFPNARLVLFRSRWGDVLDLAEFPAFDGLGDQIEWRDIVPIEQLPDELARFDINLAPLEAGNIFCESKSELKFYEAALVDVPTVASPTEPYRNAIRHGETGFLAETADEWCDAITRLVEDPGLRARIARAAQYEAIATYGPERRVELFTSVLDQVLGTARRGARAFELDVARKARTRPKPPHVPEHEIVFESDRLIPSQATVIVPLYNYAGYVAEALDSVAAQTLKDIDLIVVDDRSTDESLEVARRWIEANQDRFGRALLIRNVTNSGLGFTRNVGFANADTPFVLPLDADNRLTPQCAERLVAAAKESVAAFAYPLIRQFGDADHTHGRAYEPGRLIAANYIDAMALVRRSEWAAVGGYDHVRYGWEDYDLWCRFAETGRFGVFVPESVAEYRVHQSSMLRSETDAVRNKLRLVKDIERRHPWLRIDRDPPTGPKLPDEEPPREEAAPTAAMSDGGDHPRSPEVQAARLDRILPHLRCPETGAPLERCEGGLRAVGGTRVYPLAAGRPQLFPDLGEPKVMPGAHVSNPLPPRAVAMIEETEGLVLNLSAGGSDREFDHVIEAEVAVFRHTDVVADAHKLPFADATFDLVVSMNAFEHYHSPRQAVDEIMRVLKPNGRVLVQTAFMQPLHEAPWHFYNCTRHGLERWFEAFETLDLQVSDNFNPIYALSWQLSEAEALMRRELSPADAERLLQTKAKELVELWRDPASREHQVWRSFHALPKEAQEGLAAGFEFLGRKPQ